VDLRFYRWGDFHWEGRHREGVSRTQIDEEGGLLKVFLRGILSKREDFKKEMTQNFLFLLAISDEGSLPGKLLPKS